ncbi:MAG: tRNA lysidine(34) synthetase TilS, partial [Flavobacteriales bacterium]|nr:tRNA lysidine(34) synthetase TilS [Flavobacteriales bacterium]
MSPPLKHRVRRTLTEKALLKPGQAVLVAVSGGADSMVLLDVLHHLGYACTVANLDHGLRGAEGASEQRMVREHCASLGIPFVGHTLQPGALQQREGSVQMAARQVRYAWLNQCAAELEIGRVAMAHHRDDALETLFMNLLRGAGLAGWASIPYRSGSVVRPLLDATREDILSHAKDFQVPFCEDPSNADPKYRRNRVRSELFPLLSKLAPGWERAAGRSLDLLRDLVEHARRSTDASLGEGNAEVLRPSE